MNINQILKEYGLSGEQVKIFEDKLSIFDKKNQFKIFKELMNVFPHPTLRDVENYYQDTSNKLVVKGIDFGGIDQLLCQILNGLTISTSPEEAFPKLVSYLNLVMKYEEEEQKHTHKGAIYFNIGQYLLKHGQIENALHFIHRGLIEDDMKHKGKTKYPNVWSYRIITLDKNFDHFYVKDMIKFIDKKILRGNYSYDDLYNNFLNKPEIVTSNHIGWLNHIAFFHYFLYHLKNRYKNPNDLYYSVLGEITSSNLIGDLCLLIESVCKLDNPSLNKTGRETFNDIHREMQKKYSWKGPGVNGNNFVGAALNGTLSQIFANSYQGSHDPLLNSFYLSWGLRNKVNHKIETIRISELFEKIINKQFEFLLDFIIN